MKIEEIDKNFKAVETDENGFDWYNAKDLQLYGVEYTDEGYIRIPHSIASQVSEGVEHLAKNTAGGRVRFSTSSKKIAIKAQFSSVTKFSHMPLTGSAGFSLIADYENAPSKVAKMFFPPYEMDKEFTLAITLNDNTKGNIGYTLAMPLYSSVKELYIGVEHGCGIGKGKAYKDILPILYYGSSITQGGCASRPFNDYEGLISKWHNLDFINLGFSGNAKGEDIMAEYIAQQKISVFVYDYDHNAPDIEHLRKTHSRFFNIFRKAQPDTPVVFMTRPAFVEYTEEEVNERAEIIEKTYRDALASGDKNVYFIDGRNFMECEDASACSVDECHPTDLGFYFMAKRLEPVLCKILNI